MLNKILYLLLFITFTLSTYSQQDSVWNLDDLKVEDYDFTPDFQVEFSKGWFPSPLVNSWGIGIMYESGDLFDVADNIRSNSFHPTLNAFKSGNDFTSDELKIKKANSKDFEDDYPLDSYYALGIYSVLSTKYLTFTGTLAYARTFDIISSIDESRSYLGLGGIKKKFKETSFINLSEYSLRTGVGINIPVYGAFLKEMTYIGSYYYLSAAINADIAWSSSADQYFQIMNEKDILRYKNGSDTVQVMNDAVLSNLNRTKLSIEIGIGQTIITNFVGLNYEIKYTYPLTSIVNDADWKRHYLSISVKLYYNELFDK
jgi:hypothetical protein